MARGSTQSKAATGAGQSILASLGIAQLKSIGIFSPLNVLIFLYFALGATVYGALEGWSTLDTTYFLMISATTVGYGDFCPETKAGKLFTCIYALLGMTIIMGALMPIIDYMVGLIERAEHVVMRVLERRGLIPPPVRWSDPCACASPARLHARTLA